MFKYCIVIAIVSSVSVTYGEDIQQCNAKNYYFNTYYCHLREFGPNNVWIPKWEEYITEVAQEFVYEIEDFGLCNVPLLDYSENISRTFFGYELKGIIKYRNGFIGTMQKASLRDSGYSYPSVSESDQTITIDCVMSLEDFILYFDYFVYLTKGNFSGTVGIPLKVIEFGIKVIIHYDGDDVSVKGNLNLMEIGPARNQKWTYLPTNKYIEIINRQNKYDALDTFRGILKTTWHTLLGNVLRKIPIPEHCFNCNIKTT
ncbi:hypothetical protein CBL_14526 [Carabus blaptoides fortunei]